MKKKLTLGEIKAIAYAGSTVGAAGICFTVAFFTDWLPLYLCFWTCFGAVLGSCIARVVLHVMMKDWSAEMWQVSIYHMVTAGGILGLIYCNSWGWASFFAALIVGMGLMAGGTRFLDQVGGTLILYKIESEMRYYPKEDKAGAEDDMERPVCLYDGKALTVREAEEAGLTEAADLARKNLAGIYGIVIEEKKEKEEK